MKNTYVKMMGLMLGLSFFSVAIGSEEPTWWERLQDIGSRAQQQYEAIKQQSRAALQTGYETAADITSRGYEAAGRGYKSYVEPILTGSKKQLQRAIIPPEELTRIQEEQAQSKEEILKEELGYILKRAFANSFLTQLNRISTSQQEQPSLESLSQYVKNAETFIKTAHDFAQSINNLSQMRAKFSPRAQTRLLDVDNKWILDKMITEITKQARVTENMKTGDGELWMRLYTFISNANTSIDNAITRLLKPNNT